MDKKVAATEMSRPLIGNEPTEKVENPTVIEAQIAAYSRFRVMSQGRKDRLVDLMRRKSATRWDAKKKAQMVRRLVTAEQSVGEAVTAIDQLEHRLSQITTV